MKSWMKRILKLDRYFIVFYNASLDRGYCIGQSAVKCDNGLYLNRNLITIDLLETHTHFKHLVITGIIELNKKDYLTFIYINE
jgi:hypothetical protein